MVIAFVFSALLGFISHAPGSLGVFDAAMLIALPQVEKEQLLAALVIFRGLYFVDPVLYRDPPVRPAGTGGFGQIVSLFWWTWTGAGRRNRSPAWRVDKAGLTNY